MWWCWNWVSLKSGILEWREDRALPIGEQKFRESAAFRWGSSFHQIRAVLLV
jgi:hypothetical protein